MFMLLIHYCKIFILMASIEQNVLYRLDFGKYRSFTSQASDKQAIVDKRSCGCCPIAKIKLSNTASRFQKWYKRADPRPDDQSNRNNNWGKRKERYLFYDPFHQGAKTKPR